MKQLVPGRRCLLLAVALQTHAVPLYAGLPEVRWAAGPYPDGNLHPTLVIMLALGSPAAGVAHRDMPYERSREYIGYFNPRKCYRYVGNSNNRGEGYFEISKDADALHECGGNNFSGNFMNWAAMSMLDILRYALTGGYRVTDTPQLTILQRSRVPLSPAGRSERFVRRLITAGRESSAANRVTPFDSNALYIASCGNWISFSDRIRQENECSTTASNPAGLLGRYAVRIKVCDRKEGAERAELCRRYGSHYKPVGELQRNADRMRVALIAATPEDTVLLPARYLGANRVNPAHFLVDSNPMEEWSAATGMFAGHPPDMAGPAAHASLMQYLNRHAEVFEPDAHYPIAGLYLAGLSYLQGKQHVELGDPVLAACQRNLLALITDGSGSFTVTTGESESAIFTRQVIEMESDLKGSYRNPAPEPSLAHLPDHERRWGGSYAIAGMAYGANIRDIRNDKPVRAKTFVIDLGSRNSEPASPLYLAAKYGGFDDYNNDGNPFVSGNAGADAGIEWSLNGTPASYHPVRQPAQLVHAVRMLFARLASMPGIKAGNMVSPAGMASDGSAVYLPIYNAAHWSGSLQKFSVQAGQRGELRFSDSADWDAALLLTGGNGHPPHPLPQQRRLYTIGADGNTVPFHWDSLTDTQRRWFETSPLHGRVDSLGPGRLAYLRGHREQETGKAGSIFRARAAVLGDIRHSRPLYVPGRPSSAHGESRPAMVYVGANDGMLHAFDAGTGSELFAYIPGAVLPRLAWLAEPAYQHSPLMDGMLAAGDALIEGRWKTILAAGMGAGGQGLIALDISNPAAFGESAGVLWEFTDSDDPDMGNLTGPPAIAKFLVSFVNGMPQYQYFVVVPSGLNHYRNDGAGRYSRTGEAALFLLAVEKRPGERWQEGLNYYKFRLPRPDASLANGLSSPVLATGADGAVRHAYAGDLQGNLWRFDFDDPSRWSAARPVRQIHTLLFTARDGDGRRQPITSQPQLAFARGRGYLVLFGTGKYLEDEDAAAGTFRIQSFYGIHDRLEGGYMVAGREELAQRKLVPAGAKEAGLSAAALHVDAVAASGKGWYFDFLSSDRSGERSISNAQVLHGRVYFNTVLPPADGCSTGSSRSYVLDVLTGLAINGNAVGLLSANMLMASPGLFVRTVSTSPVAAGGRRSITKRISVVNTVAGSPLEENSGPLAETGSETVVLPAGRLSWREIPNWQELRDEAGKK